MAKVKITGLPKAMMGSEVKDKKTQKHTQPVLQPEPREDANVEVEKGEVIVSTDGASNQKRTAVAGGKKHYDGGTPVNLRSGSAVYSDHLKLSDPALLQVLGFSGNQPKTFAQIAKKWELSTLVDKREESGIDQIKKRSLDKSIEDSNFKLSLAFVLQQFHEKKGNEQKEHSRHFEPFLERTGMSYEQLFDAMEEGESSLSNEPPSDGVGVDNAQLGTEIPKMPHGGDHIEEYNTSKTTAGGITPTGRSNYYKSRHESLEDYAAKWEKVLGQDIRNMSNKDAQKVIYDWALEKNPDSIRNMWLTYGLTAKGMNNPTIKKLSKEGKFNRAGLVDPAVLKELENAYVDDLFGARQLDPNAPKLDEDTVIETIDPLNPYKDEKYQWNYQGLDATEAPINMDYRWENKRALAQAKKNRRNIPYLRPLTAVSDTFYTDQAYYSPDQAIAALQSESAAMQQQRAMFAGPQQQLANQMASQSMQMIGKVVSDYADKNVDAYNKERLFNTQVAQTAANENAAQIEAHHGKVTMLKQNFANAYMNADNAVAEQEIAMHKERAQRKNLEASIGEQYIIDPDTGLHVFVKGKDYYPDTTPETSVDDVYMEMMRKHPTMDPNVAAKLAMAKMSGKYQVQDADWPVNIQNYNT
jgi:hypothetical protein